MELGEDEKVARYAVLDFKFMAGSKTAPRP
jgi:hypothetical protein